MKNFCARNPFKLSSALVLALLPLLAACGGVEGDPAKTGPSYSEEAFRSAAGEFAGGAATLAEAAAESETALVLESFPTGAELDASPLGVLLQPHSPSSATRLFSTAYYALEHTDGDLPRGAFVYNEESNLWESTSATDNLVLGWTYRDAQGAHDAELTVDWDASGNTEVIDNGEGSDSNGGGSESFEVPTGMNVKLRADGTVLADVDAALSWFGNTYCDGTVIFYDPRNLSASGFIGDDAARLAFDVSAGAKDNDGEGADTLSSKGAVTLSAGADEASVNWDVSASGTLVEIDEETVCGLQFDTDRGSVSLGSAVRAKGKTNSFNLSFDFSAIGQSMSSVTLQNGVVTLSGETALLFSGTLDDANENGVPGENLTLTFDGQTTTLEALLNDLIKDVVTSSVSKLTTLLR